jgi:hypothetical protein
MNKYLLIIGFGVWLGLLAGVLSAQTLPELQKETQELKKELEYLKVRMIHYKLDSLQKQKEVNLEIQRYKNEIIEKTNMLNVYLAIFGASGIGAFLVVMYQFIWGFNKVVRQEAQEIAQKIEPLIIQKFADLTDQKISHIERAIQEESRLAAIHQKAKIAVICRNNSRYNDMKWYFLDLGFNNLTVDVFKEFDPQMKVYDLLIFDNWDIPSVLKVEDINTLKQPEDQTQIQLMLKCLEEFKNEKLYMIHYGGGRMDFLSKYDEKANFANTRFTLYPRIIETLTFAYKKGNIDK